jgi:regulatory protein
MMNPRKYPPEVVREKIRQWCDRGERAHSDVRSKLYRWGIPSQEREELITDLIRDNLLNEERYACAFANDHFRFRKWGVNKIVHALKAKGVSERNIARAVKQLPAEEITPMMRDLLRKLEPKLKGLQAWQKKQKAIRHLISKGFQTDAAVALCEDYFPVPTTSS